MIPVDNLNINDMSMPTRLFTFLRLRFFDLYMLPRIWVVNQVLIITEVMESADFRVKQYFSSTKKIKWGGFLDILYEVSGASEV